MGSSQSKQVEDKASLAKFSDHPVQTSDISTGFHILEVHMPSIGMGWMSMAFILAGALAIYAIWRRYCARGSPLDNSQRHLGPTLWDSRSPRAPPPYIQDAVYGPMRRDYAETRFDLDRFHELSLPREPRTVYAPPATLQHSRQPLTPAAQIVTHQEGTNEITTESC